MTESTDNVAAIHVSAPSRLHFGLMAFGRPTGRQHGGVGMMVAAPRVELSISPAERFGTAGLHKERVTKFANRWAKSREVGLPPCRVEVTAAPPQHVGLGLGTQLGLSVVTGLEYFCGLPESPIEELSARLGRGAKSAVGTYGHRWGGLIYDAGKLPEEDFSQLRKHVELPGTWRVALFLPQVDRGLYGQAEVEAFRALPPVRKETSERLKRDIEHRIIPVAVGEDFAVFSDALYSYGVRAGNCFAEIQGGPFNGPITTRLVHDLRQLGIVGVGQSSWGPTVFALLEHQAAADQFGPRMHELAREHDRNLIITAVDNRGAVVGPAAGQPPERPA